MQYTLKSARRILRESSNAYGQNDLRDSINRAIQSLAGMKGWVHLRKSNTEPIIRVYSEAKDEARANELAKQVMAEV